MHQPPAVAEALARYKGALVERFGERLRELILFGSYARGEAHEDSDVDVMVAVEGLTEAERGEVIDLAYFQGLAVDDTTLLSPLPYSTEQAARMRAGGRRLFSDIDREGIPL
jgi:predicted nucleotidyltransferase